MSPRWKMAIPAALASGCFSVPPYEPEDAVSYTEAGTGALVAGKGFALQFAGGDGFHFPDALMIDGVDVMGHEPTRGCFREDETGLLIAPTPRISAHSIATPVKSLLVPVLRGPAVVQAIVEWSTGLGCNAARNPGGTSTFTVFPDGRIVRHDQLADVSASPILPTPCKCEDLTDSRDQLFNLSTYWTFARESFSQIYFPDETPASLPDPGSAGFGNKAPSCIDGVTRQVAFAWSDVANTTIRSSDTLVIFDRRLAYGLPEITALSKEESSAIFLGREGCEAALARAEAHDAKPALTINTAEVKPSGRDGIYGGDGGDGREPGIELPSGRAELTGAVPGSFAVWLRFPGAVDAVRATRAGATGAWYLPQQVDDRSWIVWFRDPLLAGQTIAIEPR